MESKGEFKRNVEKRSGRENTRMAVLVKSNWQFGIEKNLDLPGYNLEQVKYVGEVSYPNRKERADLSKPLSLCWSDYTSIKLFWKIMCRKCFGG